MKEAQFGIDRGVLVDWLVRSAIPTAAIYAGHSELAVQLSSLDEVTEDILEGRGRRPRPGIVKTLIETERRLSPIWCDAHNSLIHDGYMHDEINIGIGHPLRETLGYSAAWTARNASWPSNAGFHAYIVFRELMDLCLWSDWPDSGTFDKALNAIEIQVLERVESPGDVGAAIKDRKEIRALLIGTQLTQASGALSASES